MIYLFGLVLTFAFFLGLYERLADSAHSSVDHSCLHLAN